LDSEYLKFNEILCNFKIEIQNSEQRNEKISQISLKIDASISDFSISTDTFVDDDASTDACERFENFLAQKVHVRQSRMNRREIVRRSSKKNDGL
jgi:hypothetical protein